MTIYTRRLNGILADEMGLGKTIMTISLLAHLACEKYVCLCLYRTDPCNVICLEAASYVTGSMQKDFEP